MDEDKSTTVDDATKTSDGLRVESVKMKLGDVNVEVEGANVTLRFRSEEIAGGIRGALEEGSLERMMSKAVQNLVGRFGSKKPLPSKGGSEG